MWNMHQSRGNNLSIPPENPSQYSLINIFAVFPLPSFFFPFPSSLFYSFFPFFVFLFVHYIKAEIHIHIMSS